MTTQLYQLAAFNGEFEKFQLELIMKVDALKEQVNISMSGNVPALLPFRLIPTTPDTPFPNPDMRRQTG